MNEITAFRAQKDEFFENHPQSPLPPDQKKNFDGLKYFPVNSALEFEIEIEEYEDQQTVTIQTTTGDLREFIRFGKIRFVVDGQQAALTVFSNEHGFFIPFVDALAGEETYGAGRYLEPEMLPDGKLVLNFNLAYNPYCAYNELYSCPLPPTENRLSVAIRAGEKNFKAG